MSLHFNIQDFLSPVNIAQLCGDENYKNGQLGKAIDIYDGDNFPDVEAADIIFIGCGEQRGAGVLGPANAAPDVVRNHFYQLYYWHENIKMADIGNVIPGDTYNDTIAALKTVMAEINALGKTAVVLGGSHDLTLAQYEVYKSAKQIIEASIVDAVIDLDMESPFKNDHFLMEMITGEPNYLKHYNHIAFQSYLVHPGMLQTLDKLKFDFYRVGHVKENIEEIEPGIRSSHLFSFDVNALANAYAPSNLLTPNGLNGEEACILMQYAGLSAHANTIGIYGYDAAKDKNELTAKQISHMLWYFIDGRYKRKKEAALEDREFFDEYQMAFSEIETAFLRSKKTGRWWMQLPDKKYIACSYKDYLLASSDEIPERWFRAQQR